MELKNKFILDACCSVKAMWYDKNHPNAVYIDIREEPNGFMGYGRKEGIHPDCIMDFRKMEFPDNSFKLIVFEPPHLSKLGKTSLFRKKFGCLNAETWQSDLKRGFAECWRVLDDYGTLIFKWSDSEIPFQKVLALIEHRPLFYNTTNYKATSVTKWFCFMKIPNGVGGFTSAMPIFHAEKEFNKDFTAHSDSPKVCPPDNLCNDCKTPLVETEM